MQQKLNSLLTMARVALTRDDRGENSIMQVISIAVSAILIVAGLVTAPSLIQSARNTNAQNDLANIAYVEEYVNSNSGAYMPLTDAATQTALTTATADSVSGTSAKLTLTAGNKVAVVLAGATYGGYIAVVGTDGPVPVWWGRTGASTKMVKVSTGATPPTSTQLTTAFGGTPPAFPTAISGYLTVG